MEAMRVLQVIGAMNRAGAETVVMNLYRAIDRERLQFDFLVNEFGRCDYDDEIESLGGRIYRIPRYKIYNYPIYRKACHDFFREHTEHPVVHAHISSSASIYLHEARATGRATVLHSHSRNSLSPVPLFLWKQILINPSLKEADEFLACSLEAGEERFGRETTIQDNFHVMQNGIDLERYRCTDAQHQQAKEELGFGTATVVGHVGRLIEIKNHKFLFETFAQFKKAHHDSVLVLLGGGPLEDELKQHAAQLGIGDSVRFMGVRDDVPRFLKAFDLFIFPSFREGLPMAMVEAQAAGARCLVSSGVPESVVASGATRQLDLDLGAQVWADAMDQALAMPWKREQGAIDVGLHGYDINSTAKMMTELYERLASDVQRGR